MFYVHPWELDPDQPRIRVPTLTALRHYRGLEATATRLDRLLGSFRFSSVADALARGTALAGGVPCAPPLDS